MVAGAGGYLAVVVVAGHLFATVNEVGDFPADTLWFFRRASLITLATMWAVIGVVLGTISAVVTLVAYTIGRADTLYPTGSPLIYVGVVGFAVTLTLLASLVPGWRATRRPPVGAAVAP